MMYLLLTGSPPFVATSEDALFKAIVLKPIDEETYEWQSLSVNAKDLIKKLLIKQPRQRITLDAAL
jgi:calcium-dependent protein kinase